MITYPYRSDLPLNSADTRSTNEQQWFEKNGKNSDGIFNNGRQEHTWPIAKVGYQSYLNSQKSPHNSTYKAIWCLVNILENVGRVIMRSHWLCDTYTITLEVNWVIIGLGDGLAPIRHTENNKDLTIWQFWRHWWHRKLSWWQFAVPPVTPKLSNWGYFFFSAPVLNQPMMTTSMVCDI